MLFNSFQFLLFFPIVTALYFMLRHNVRWFMLLAASCYFYMAFIPYYILILALTIVVDYFAGIYIENSVGRRRKMYLWASIIVTCAILFVFKYINFFNDNFKMIGGDSWPFNHFNIILPIGLSFHTFQSLAYVVEVYRGNQKAERHFGIYSLYVMFYPQLVAGPIERPQNLLGQFRTKHNFDYDRVVSGLRLMLWGLMKKVLIADRLAVFVNEAYGDVNTYQGIPLIVAAYFFTFQIYCDFSGYSDMAIGAARVMGFDLMTNFRTPYFSLSIREFWSRWHISLSTWFRDYLYIPLGGNRVSKTRWYLNIFIVFMVSGFWHGASWTFIIWGALHGIYNVLSIALTPAVDKVHARLGDESKAGWLLKGLRWFVVFHLVVLAWVFFRAPHISDAFAFLQNMTHISKAQVGLHMFPIKEMEYLREFILCFLAVGTLFVVEYAQDKYKLSAIVNRQPVPVKWAVYFTAVFILLFFGMFHSAQEFIYFQF